MIFSWNDVDPTAPDGSDAIQHETRGSASLNLLGGLPNPPPEPSDSEEFFIGVNNVSVFSSHVHAAVIFTDFNRVLKMQGVLW